MLHSCIKGFLRAKKLWVNPPKAERAKPSLSSDYNLLFKSKIGERSLDIHREIVTPELHPVVAKMIEAGVAAKCDSYEALAKHIGCPVDGLKADIEEHNAVTRLPAEKRRDRFGRTVYQKELKAPFYALQVKPVMIETVGGITINEKSEVTTLLGRPIAKGLFAAGAVAFGEHFGTGCRSGEAYVYAGVTGMVAGEQAAKLK